MFVVHYYYQAIYFYAPEGRGPCLAFEGPKKLMTYFRSHLVVVGADPHATVGTAGALLLLPIINIVIDLDIEF